LLSFGWFHLWARSFSFDLASSVYRNNSCFSLNSKNQLSCKEPRSVLKNLHRLLLIHCTFPWWFWVVFVVQNNFFAKNQKAFGDFQKQFTVFSFCVLGHSCFSLVVMNVFFVSSLRLLLWKNKVFSVSYGHGVGCWNSVSQTLASRRESLILFGRFSFVGKKFIRRPQQPNLFPAAFSLCTNPLFLSPHTEHVW